MDTFFDIVNEAVEDLATHGYDSVERVAAWERKIRDAAATQMKPEHVMEQMLRDAMTAVYRRMVEKGQIVRYHPDVARYTIDKVRHQLRAELDRRILASANLIKLNRQEAINKTLQRFSGWSTSIPRGGVSGESGAKARKDIKKSLRSLPFVERRVLIDQGHKLTASLNNIVAVDGGAIALMWRSNWRQAGYNYREDHKERDGQVYLIRDNWAQQKGFVKAGPDGYYDQITAVAEEPYCRCYAVYIYALGKMPRAMLTKKGEAVLTDARREMAA